MSDRRLGEECCDVVILRPPPELGLGEVQGAVSQAKWFQPMSPAESFS